MHEQILRVPYNIKTTQYNTKIIRGSIVSDKSVLVDLMGGKQIYCIYCEVHDHELL